MHKSTNRHCTHALVSVVKFGPEACNWFGKILVYGLHVTPKIEKRVLKETPHRAVPNFGFSGYPAQENTQPYIGNPVKFT